MNTIKEKYLEIKNLNFYYGNSQVLTNINTSFEKNKITTIIGPSGSGKSTLLRTINRIYALYPNQTATGEILFEKNNLLDDHAFELNQIRRDFGMVFQKPTPFPMSIYHNIAFAIRLHDKLSKSDISKRVQSALIKAALWEEVKDKLTQPGIKLSIGQQQRLCIARTIAIKPKVLLLDEPTSALDPIATKKIEALILDLKKNHTIIMVTHHLNQAKKISDNTLCMMNGSIIEYQNTKQFFETPKDKRTMNYIENT